jgi:hypothetical protein
MRSLRHHPVITGYSCVAKPGHGDDRDAAMRRNLAQSINRACRVTDEGDAPPVTARSSHATNTMLDLESMSATPARNKRPALRCAAAKLTYVIRMGPPEQQERVLEVRMLDYTHWHWRARRELRVLLEADLGGFSRRACRAQGSACVSYFAACYCRSVALDCQCLHHLHISQAKCGSAHMKIPCSAWLGLCTMFGPGGLK